MLPKNESKEIRTFFETNANLQKRSFSILPFANATKGNYSLEQEEEVKKKQLTLRRSQLVFG